MQTTRADRPATARQTLAPVLLSLAAVTAALLWYAATSRAEVYAVTGNSYPGTLTAVAEPLGFNGGGSGSPSSVRAAEP